MTMPTMAQPRHFAGEITALTMGCCLGLHRMEVQLTDDDGGEKCFVHDVSPRSGV